MPEENGIEIRWLLEVMLRRLWIILGLTFLAAAAGFIVTSRMKPVYEASAILLVNPNADANTSEYNAIITGERLALTYSQMLKGRTVLEAVIKKLDLSDTPNALAAKVTATPIKDTQLIRLSVKSSSPSQAALLANTIAEAFVEHVHTLSVERYNDSINTTQAKIESLSAQIDKSQSDIDALNAKKIMDGADITRLENLLEQYRSDYRSLNQSYQNLQLTAAQLTDRVHIVEAAQVPIETTGEQDYATLTMLVDQTMVTGEGSYSANYSSERLANSYGPMMKSRSVLEAAIAKLGLEITPDELVGKIHIELVPGTQLIRLNLTDPDPGLAVQLADAVANAFIVQIRALLARPYDERLANTQSQMDQLSALADQTQVQIKTLTEAKVQAETELARLDTQISQDRTDYRAAQRDYEQLRLSAAGAAQNVALSEQAQVPLGPVQSRMQYILLAILIGGMIGAGLAFVLEQFEDKIRTQRDVHRILGLIPLATIGKFNKRDDALVMRAEPDSGIAESFHILGSNLRFASLSRPIRTLVVTSPVPNEGKSFVTSNLGISLAQTGLRVAIVDADMRLPHIHRFFGIDQGDGLSNSLINGNFYGNLKPTEIEGLSILTSGPLPPNPSEVVNSPYLADLLKNLAEQFDLVLLDTPPVLPVADAAILASLADGVLLVLRSGYTENQPAKEAVEKLKQAGANLVGVALNASTAHRAYYYYHYYGNGNKNGKDKQYTPLINTTKEVVGHILNKE